MMEATTDILQTRQMVSEDLYAITLRFSDGPNESNF
jgi:hypothetical protein